MRKHSQVYIKVNAPCDAGVASLVEALNRIDGLVTVDSCQEGSWGAYVYFTYGNTWQDLASLLQSLSSELAELPVESGYSLNLEWLGSNDRPRARVSLAPEHVAYLADGVQKVAASLNARMTELVGGKLCRGLPSWTACSDPQHFLP